METKRQKEVYIIGHKNPDTVQSVRRLPMPRLKTKFSGEYIRVKMLNCIRMY